MSGAPAGDCTGGRNAVACLAAAARTCRACPDLPLGPRPVLRAGRTARLLIVGQAPGARVHRTGLPWNDPSGDRLRQWLDLDRATFYDPARVAIVPMGLCYPGRDPRGGDRPPRRICAPLWLDPLRTALTPDLVLAVGRYAQHRLLADAWRGSMTATVRDWRALLPEGRLPLPHPSWRNTTWLTRNGWFGAELLPALRATIARLVAAPRSC